ncbi:MAG: HK97 family phage prohead protease [Phascolarctobacterium sp.]
MPLNREQLLALTREERQNLARYRSSTVGTFNAEQRTVEISFASQTPCPDFWGDAEVLRCTDEAMNTERFDQGVMPILFNHKRDEVIGKPLKIWCENGVARALIQFAETEKAKEIMGMVRDGFLKGVSVGYRVSEWEFFPSGSVSE